jgi:hypothetical protein
MADQSPHAAEVPLIGLEAQNALDAGLQKAGVFCSLCGRPVDEGQQFMQEYLIIEVTAAGVDGQPLTIGTAEGAATARPIVNLRRVYWCQRDTCDASQVAERAHAARMVPAWTLFAGPEEPEASS